MSNLRNKIIRLAHQKPELRKHLLPLLEKQALTSSSVESLFASFGMEMVDDETSRLGDDLTMFYKKGAFRSRANKNNFLFIESTEILKWLGDGAKYDDMAQDTSTIEIKAYFDPSLEPLLKKARIKFSYQKTWGMKHLFVIYTKKGHPKALVPFARKQAGKLISLMNT